MQEEKHIFKMKMKLLNHVHFHFPKVIIKLLTLAI